MRIDHCRLDILMPKQFLNRADVVPILQEMGRKRVAQCVATGSCSVRTANADAQNRERQ